MKIRQASIIILLSASALGLAGCKRDEVVSYRAPKEPPKSLAAVSPTDVMLTDAHAAEPQERGEEKRLDWTVPADWKAMPARSMRYATLAAKADPTVELAVFPLPPQPLLPNVNRWEGQLGLPPTPEADLGKVVKHLDVNGIPVETVDLLGPVPAAGQPRMQMLAAVINEPNRSWFFKMMGPAEKVGPQKANFDAFIRSLRFSSYKPAASPSTQPVASGEAKPTARLAEWQTPAGWVQDPQPRPMRVATFNITRGNERAEVIVSQLAKDNIGDLPSNINRWRAQVGLGPVADVNSVKAQQIVLGGATGMLYDFVGPESEGAAKKHLLVAMTAVGDDIWFFKMIGPESLVTEQKPAFESFLKSTRFVGEKP
ncbi:MAG: hypothetical protein ACM359_20940 [Bacillota bacterium]